ncbi:Protein CBG09078 [Caenorhabditis briggsae]|nr:Protein CBG09078 [Caenorhabditis briggsae]CAP28711.1 Protein CBG09078 [Caenorhabditis briggsae]
MDTFFSYGTCCDNECCYRLRYWVYPASIAGIGFVAGAFFALCFQCR